MDPPIKNSAEGSYLLSIIVFEVENVPLPGTICAVISYAPVSGPGPTYFHGFLSESKNIKQARKENGGITRA